MAAPALRLFELCMCRNYYRTQDLLNIGHDCNVLESLCKVAPVQQEVAFIDSMLFAIALDIFTISLGIVADQYGRKIVLGLNLASKVLFHLIIGMLGYFPDVLPPRAFIFTYVLQPKKQPEMPTIFFNCLPTQADNGHVGSQIDRAEP
ncbi:hypothetical protein BU24DRAFT_457664 [Aaosphaeria arxii CBS 175.79]|uniref:Uncharacterized protein n=1 Tax=Aaosphaeria arxii CBS 175.79 TaxID=1450172 RepID=A0A6A5YAC5_9PLEO|nr:uncharacterized protein BU24DRAFT_457664 [Aaosphaeria arxii CBS 175.79]KAF2021711.1 hypothetical protein BU24DRAFT_457664 [Aaosphaeria arxii CBS 175.79]